MLAACSKHSSECCCRRAFSLPVYVGAVLHAVQMIEARQATLQSMLQPCTASIPLVAPTRAPCLVLESVPDEHERRC